ncbi:MAG TPA: phosphatidylserine decarboxylase [Bryobacteraceae bacterium]|jgi:phosphatidylserine decarboxylase
MVITGIYYALGLIAGGLAAGYFIKPAWGIPFYILAAFCLNFFRDPDRAVPGGPVAVSPADGKIVSVKEMDPTHTRVSIFMNVFDVHVNRSPIAGVIREIQYKPGKFLNAAVDEAATDNEQNVLTVDGEDGAKVVFTQIAGLIARRIICYKHPGDRVKAGERIGLIKFGSRVDVFFGPEWNVDVKPGETVSAGLSILARRK